MKITSHFFGETYARKLSILVLIPALTLLVSSCSSSSKGGKPVTEPSGASKTVTTGPSTTESYERTATVTAIDPTTRKIQMEAPDGWQTTIIAGPEVRNFDQIRVGDRVKATTTRSMVVSLHPPGTAPTASQSSTMTVAPKGAKPGAVRTETTEVPAKVLSTDAKHHTATLHFTDGTTSTLKVAEDVDLSHIKPGQDVSVGLTESVAIRVESP